MRQAIMYAYTYPGRSDMVNPIGNMNRGLELVTCSCVRRLYSQPNDSVCETCPFLGVLTSAVFYSYRDPCVYQMTNTAAALPSKRSRGERKGTVGEGRGGREGGGGVKRVCSRGWV